MVGPVSLPLSFGNGEVFPHRSLPLVGQQVKGVVSAPILASVTLHSNNCVPISPCSMPERSADWMDQARRDLAMAGQARDTGFFERMFRIAAGCRKGDKGRLPETWGRFALRAAGLCSVARSLDRLYTPEEAGVYPGRVFPGGSRPITSPG